MVSPRSAPEPAKTDLDSRPNVAIIIVNWNGRDDTLTCLQSVSALQYASYRIILVDNGSTDGSPEAIREAFPDVTVIETRENLGFAEGNNVGIRTVLDSDYIFLLNNDTTVAPNLLHDLVSAAESAPDMAAAGPIICYRDHPETVWCGGLQIGRGSMFGLPLRYTTSVLMYCGRPVQKVPEQPYEVDAVIGCAMLIRTRVLREIGLLDASLFMIHEDFDWSLRARAAGYRTIIIPVAGVFHRVSASIEKQGRKERINPFAEYYWYRNWLVVVGKHFGRNAMMAVALMYALRLFPSLIFRSIRKSEFSPAVCSAYGFALLDAARGVLKKRFVR